MDHPPRSPKNIEQTFTVPVSINQAFDVFIAEINTWWPPEYTWAGDVLETIEIEPAENGRCFERGPHGFELDWGRVLVWNPPYRIVFTWQIDPNRVPEPNPQKASEVEVSFKQKDGENTQINFYHKHFGRHGDNAKAYREALGSSRGWPFILNNYKEAVS